MPKWERRNTKEAKGEEPQNYRDGLYKTMALAIETASLK